MTRARIARFLQANGLTLAFVGLTALSVCAHALTGHAAENSDRSELGAPLLSFREYLRSGVFLSSLFENWESEFLQMGLFVLLTVWLRQKGSSESKPLDERSDPEEEDAYEITSQSPWPVRRGSVTLLRLYEHSLSLALFGLFLLSFVAHWRMSYAHYVQNDLRLGRVPDHGMMEHLVTGQFWFESLQNWQSEFFSVAMLVFLSIYLREKDSPQSKPVDAPHAQTGDEPVSGNTPPPLPRRQRRGQNPRSADVSVHIPT